MQTRLNRIRVIASTSIISSTIFLVGASKAGEDLTPQPTVPQNQLTLELRESPWDISLQKLKTEAKRLEMEVKKVETVEVKPQPKPTPAPPPQPKPTPKPQPKPQPAYKEITVEATAYVSYCDTGCIGITKRGTEVKDTIKHVNTKPGVPATGYGIIAVDPAIIPLGSIVEVQGQKYIADDTGGDIKGHRIDILVAVHDTSKAFDFGRQTLKVKVFNAS